MSTPTRMCIIKSCTIYNVQIILIIHFLHSKTAKFCVTNFNSCKMSSFPCKQEIHISSFIFSWVEKMTFCKSENSSHKILLFSKAKGVQLKQLLLCRLYVHVTNKRILDAARCVYFATVGIVTHLTRKT